MLGGLVYKVHYRLYVVAYRPQYVVCDDGGAYMLYIQRMNSVYTEF